MALLPKFIVVFPPPLRQLQIQVRSCSCKSWLPFPVTATTEVPSGTHHLGTGYMPGGCRYCLFQVEVYIHPPSQIESLMNGKGNCYCNSES